MSTEPNTTLGKTMPIWEAVNMTQEQFKAFEERMAAAANQKRREAVAQYLTLEWNDLAFWERQYKTLEMLRSRYNKIPAWSAAIVKEVEALDQQMKECEERIDEIWDNAERIEDMNDW